MAKNIEVHENDQTLRDKVAQQLHTTAATTATTVTLATATTTAQSKHGTFRLVDTAARPAYITAASKKHFYQTALAEASSSTDTEDHANHQTTETGTEEETARFVAAAAGRADAVPSFLNHG